MGNLAALLASSHTNECRRSRILLVVDGSEESERAIEAGGELARVMDGEIVVLNVHERNVYLVGSGDFITLVEAHRFVARVVRRLRELDVPAWGEVHTAPTGRAADVIVTAASTPGIDLVLIGAPKVSRFRALLGRSVVEKVIGHSGRPVLAVN